MGLPSIVRRATSFLTRPPHTPRLQADLKIASCGTKAECDKIAADRATNEASAPATPIPTTPVGGTKVEGGAQCGGMGWGGSTVCVAGYECSASCVNCGSTMARCVKSTTTTPAGGGGGGTNGVSSGNCETMPSCAGCLWLKHTACYAEWTASTCSNFAADGYVWCGGGSASTGGGAGKGTWQTDAYVPASCPSVCGQPQSTLARKVWCSNGASGTTTGGGTTTGSGTTTGGGTTGATSGGSSTGSTTTTGGSTAGATPASTGSCPSKMSLAQCNDFKAKCQTQCLTVSGGVTTNQCWGSPIYTKCHCANGDYYHVPGYTCAHSSCDEEAKNAAGCGGGASGSTSGSTSGTGSTGSTGSTTFGWVAGAWTPAACPMGCGQAASARTRAVGCSKGGVTGDETKCTDAGTKPAPSFACPATNACGKRSWRQARWPQYLPTPKKVTWAYYYLAQAHVTAAQIIAQKINYVVVSFAQIETDGSVVFPGGGCSGATDVAGCAAGIAKLKADGWFKELHDAGVVIGISIGGAHAKIPKTVDASAAVKFAKNMENHGILKYVHALDLDWETTSPKSLTNSEMGKVINQVSLIFKNAGWIVTTAPMASQLHSGCGFGWQGNMNDMAELDHANFDGILLQWYQTSCANLGHCPKAVCGLTPGGDWTGAASKWAPASCFDLDWAATMIANFETVGACSKDGTQTGETTWADCTAPAVKSTCKTIPVEKITVGGGLYYKSTWRQPDGILTAQNIFDLDAKLGGRLQGAGAWSINFGLVGGNKPAGDHSKPSDPNFFPDLGTKWKIVLPPTRRRLSLGSGSSGSSSSSSSSSSPRSPWRQLASGSCSGKPAGVQVCPVAAKCPTIQTHKWVAGRWEPETCETSCGLASSTRSRTVTCQASTTAAGVIVGDSKCATAGLAPGKGSVCPATAPCAPVTGTTSSSPVPTSTACARESAFQGFANPLDVSKTKTTTAIMALQEIPAASAKDWPTAPMVTYAGGSNWPTGFSFDGCERMGHYDFVLIGFNDRWEKSATKNCKAPQTGSIGFPYLNTAACVGGEQDANLDGCMMNPCGAPIGKQILAAQKKGQRILLSVGGATSPDVSKMTPQKGIDLAKAIWEVYLGGSDPAYLDYRPFGPHVVLDGVDLDIEDQPADCPTGCGCAAGQLGWKHFVQHLRALMDTDARKKYLLTTVPINSKQTSSFGNFGAYVQGYFNGPHCQANVWEDCTSASSKCAKLLGTVNPESYLAIAWSHLDFIWPQFYPTPVEITMNSPCWWNDWLSWRRIAQGLWQPSTANKRTGSGRGGATFKNNCRVGIGFPFAPDAASGGSLNGFTTAAFAKKQLESKWSSTSGKVGSAADLTEGWGGMMGWDETWSWNTDKNKHTRELACANKNLACEKKAGNMVGADHCTCFDAKTCPVAPSGSTGGSTGGTARCGKDWGDANGRCGTSCPSKTNAECTTAGETCYASLKACSATGPSSGGGAPPATSGNLVPTAATCAGEAAFQGVGDPLDISTVKSDAAVKAAQEPQPVVPVSAASLPSAPMVTYAGGSDWPSGFTFDSCERMGHYDFVLIGFNDRWEKTKTTDCKAPDTGSVGYPYLNTAACQGGVADPNTANCLLNVCGATVGEQILKAQKKGQKILLSVGGANSVDVKTMTPQKGIDLARAVWEVYMGGTDPAYAKYRPFGAKVRVCVCVCVCDR